jgi:aryl sulfotransferase
MLILQAGLAKSGNFWLYTLLRSICKHGGLEHRSFIQHHPVYAQARTWKMSYAGQADVDAMEIEKRRCHFRVGSFCEPIADIDGYLRQCSHVWTHSPICSGSFAVLPKFDKIVYIIRDPRDVAVSYSHFVFTPHIQASYPPHYEKDPDSFRALALDGMLRDWVQHVGGYLQQKEHLRIHVVFYERLLHEFRAELDRLLAYFGIRLDEAAIQQVENDVGFAAMRKENPFHVRQGRSDEWRRVFTAGQDQQAERIAGGMLKWLNYPVAADASPSLPSLPREIKSDVLDRAIRQARRSFADEARRVATFVTGKRPLKAKAARVSHLVRRRIARSF